MQKPLLILRKTRPQGRPSGCAQRVVGHLRAPQKASPLQPIGEENVGTQTRRAAGKSRLEGQKNPEETFLPWGKRLMQQRWPGPAAERRASACPWPCR